MGSLFDTPDPPDPPPLPDESEASDAAQRDRLRLLRRGGRRSLISAGLLNRGEGPMGESVKKSLLGE